MTRDPRLTLNARQQELLEWVQRDGFVTVDDLAAHFDVTPQTIRRDVNWLADMNLLREHNPAAPLSRRAEPAHQFRERLVHGTAAHVPRREAAHCRASGHSHS